MLTIDFYNIMLYNINVRKRKIMEEYDYGRYT